MRIPVPTRPPTRVVPMLLWMFFIFIAFVSKLLLAIAMCYLIFPSERTCDECNAETLAVRMGMGGRMLQKLLMGKLQRRWCPRCGWEGLTRTSDADVVPANSLVAHNLSS
jgi:hypothetical protein